MPVTYDFRAAVEALDEALKPDALKAPAHAALQDPAVARTVLGDRSEIAAAIRRRAQPGGKLTLRRPAIVLGGVLGDRDLLDDWTSEANPQVRLSLVAGTSLLGEDEDVDAVLFEALASTAGLVQRTARALAARGALGYDALLARLPPGPTERGYLVSGVIPISDRDADRARLLAYRACEDAAGPALNSIRAMDRHLYLDAAQRRNMP